MPRFFIAPSAVSGDTVTLTGENARHASYSLRLAPGDRIKVCDQQTAYLCEMVSFDGETATARILSADPIDTEPPFAARLYQALPKGDKLDTVIQKAVECGVSEIIPFESSRCIVRAKPEAEARKTERRQRIAEEAAKQSGRGIIPQVRWAGEYVEALNIANQKELKIFLYETGEREGLDAVLEANKSAKSVALITGPEGGFAPFEADMARVVGLHVCSMGERILRCETAPVVATTAVMYATGNLS